MSITRVFPGLPVWSDPGKNGRRPVQIRKSSETLLQVTHGVQGLWAQFVVTLYDLRFCRQVLQAYIVP